MSSNVDLEAPIHVGMGVILTGTAPCSLVSVLGSCVGVTLYDPFKRRGAMAHVVLPQHDGRCETPGRFADRAVPHMVELLETMGSSRRRLHAKLCGGAKMFAIPGPLQIGEANLRAAAAALAKAGIPVIARHVGGHQGRHIRFDVATGAVTVDIAGQPPVVI